MVAKIIRLRIKQLSRFFMDMGGGFFFLFLLIICVCFWLFNNLVVSEKNSYFSLVIPIGLVFIIHYIREDRLFLDNISHQTSLLYAIEYLLLISPFLVISLISQKYIVSLIILISGISISIIPKYRVRFFTLRNPITKRYISREPDLVFLYRKYALLFSVLLTLAMAFSFIRGVSIILLLFVLLLFSEAFIHNEAIDILRVSHLSPQSFIKNKVFHFLICYFFLSLPILFVYSFFNKDTIVFSLLVPIIATFGFFYLVVSKYAYYDPKYPSSKPNTAMQIGIVGLFFPVLLPITIFLAISNYTKALDNLKDYLYDFN